MQMKKYRDELYMKLQVLLDSRDMHDLFLVIKGIYKHLSSRRQPNYEKIMDKNRLGLQNDNGADRLYRLCDMNELVITATLFPLKNVAPCVPGVGRGRGFA